MNCASDPLALNAPDKGLGMYCSSWEPLRVPEALLL